MVTDSIQQYLTKLKREGATKNTLKTRACILRKFARHLGKPFTQTTTEEIMQILESSELAPSTEQSQRIMLNAFFKWLGHPVKLPKLRTKNTLPVQPNDLVSENEVKQMIEAADHPRNKALIAVTYESAARAQEILDLRRKDITFEPTHARIRVVGKTGERIIPIVWSASYLQQWLNYCRDLNPDEGIWQGKYGPISYHRFRQILMQISEEALGRYVNPHLLRHSRATYLVKHPQVSEAVICELAGWVQGTSMMKRYIHLAGKDVEDAILAIHGKVPVHEPEASPLEPQDCPRCCYENPADARFCARCSLVLDQAEALQITEEDELLAKVLQNPQVKEAITKVLQDLLQK